MLAGKTGRGVIAERHNDRGSVFYRITCALATQIESVGQNLVGLVAQVKLPDSNPIWRRLPPDTSGGSLCVGQEGDRQAAGLVQWPAGPRGSDYQNPQVRIPMGEAAPDPSSNTFLLCVCMLFVCLCLKPDRTGNLQAGLSETTPGKIAGLSWERSYL